MRLTRFREIPHDCREPCDGTGVVAQLIGGQRRNKDVATRSCASPAAARHSQRGQGQSHRRRRDCPQRDDRPRRRCRSSNRDCWRLRCDWRRRDRGAAARVPPGDAEARCHKQPGGQREQARAPSMRRPGHSRQHARLDLGIRLGQAESVEVLGQTPAGQARRDMHARSGRGRPHREPRTDGQTATQGGDSRHARLSGPRRARRRRASMALSRRLVDLTHRPDSFRSLADGAGPVARAP